MCWCEIGCNLICYFYGFNFLEFLESKVVWDWWCYLVVGGRSISSFVRIDIYVGKNFYFLKEV